MPPIRDVEHAYRDWKGAESVCRVRVYPATTASGGLPVVIVTELDSNDGPSVTNTVEQLGAEILSRYVPEMDGAEPAFVLVEHYPDSGCRRDPLLGAEHFDVVSFAHWHPRAHWCQWPVESRRGWPVGSQRRGQPKVRALGWCRSSITSSSSLEPVHSGWARR